MEEEVLLSGWLEKRLPVLRDTWEPHWCVLRQSSLACYEAERECSVPKLELRVLKWAAFREEDAFGDAQLHRKTRPCGFVLDLGTDVPHAHQRFVHFDAATEAQLQRWLEAFQALQLPASESPQASDATPSPKGYAISVRKRTFLYRKHTYKLRKNRPRNQAALRFDVAPLRAESWRKAWRSIIGNCDEEDLEELEDTWRPASHFSTEGEKEVTAQVRGGLEAKQRRQGWFLLSGAAAKRAQGPKYEELVAAGQNLDQEEAVRVIQADLHRTGMEGVDVGALENLLLAFAAKNLKIGYCQSMSFVAATLLMYMEEEQAFWTLCSLLEDILPEDYLSERMLGVRADLKTLEKLVAEEMPELAEHLNLQGIDLAPITVNWFLCLFLNTLPGEWSHRVLDSVLYEGSAVLFRCALSILWLRREELRTCLSLPDAFAYLRSPMGESPLDANELWELMFASWLNNLSGRLRSLREEQLRLILQGEEGEVRRKILPSFSWPDLEWPSMPSMSFSWLSLSPKSEKGDKADSALAGAS
ncbi:TBC domain-containing protein C4G8.04 [Durusdinium trenchii]|uniref:TBC domain-containing protein C4G8.04 n=2 Tax=Durusdinium trenchii TaxID=1381693 RepID=A0ABP0NML9_9DINO